MISYVWCCCQRVSCICYCSQALFLLHHNIKCSLKSKAKTSCTRSFVWSQFLPLLESWEMKLKLKITEFFIHGLNYAELSTMQKNSPIANSNTPFPWQKVDWIWHKWDLKWMKQWIRNFNLPHTAWQLSAICHF